VGASDLSFSDVLLVDASDDANVISAEWITGQVQVSSPVPEPATMLLFGAGLVGLIGARLRKKK
jgi:threonine dehydrogenase-like Zn-dependent dehydrogenase